MSTLACDPTVAAAHPEVAAIAAVEFAGRGRSFLNSASVGLPPDQTLAALESATDAWATGCAQPAHFDLAVDRSRAAFARLNGVDVGEVSVAAQASYFVGLIAASLPRGAEVVAFRGDFTSMLFPFLVRPDLIVELVELDEIAEAVGPDTALVAVSSVQSCNGALADLDAIEAAARRHGAMTLIDTTQSCGWLPLDASRFDFTVCSAYKWLMCPRGVAFMTIAEARMDLIRPSAAGWYAGRDVWGSVYGPEMDLAEDARRFDLSPAWMCFSGAVPALELVERIGVDAIHLHAVGLANAARRGLGLPEGDSAILSLELPGAAERLAEAGIAAAVRDGRVRVAFHLYSTDADVAALVAALG